MDVVQALERLDGLGVWANEPLQVIRDRIAELERKNVHLAHRRLDSEIVAENRGMALASVERLAAHIEESWATGAEFANVIRAAARVPEGEH